MNLNKVIIIGRITSDPELRSTKSGTSVASMDIATNRYWTGKNGEKNEDTEFHKVVVWGNRAEVVSEYMSKGSLIMVEGRLQTRKWEDKNGNKRYTTEIVAENVQFGPSNKNDNNKKTNNKKVDQEEKIKDMDIDDIIKDSNLDEEDEIF